MSRDRDPLDAEERALAEALARALPRAGPPPELDAAILASARRASASGAAPGRRRSRGRWPAMLGVAASLALAAGLAWQLRPMPDPPLPAASEDPPALPARPAPATAAAPADPPRAEALPRTPRAADDAARDGSARLRADDTALPVAPGPDAPMTEDRRQSAPPEPLPDPPAPELRAISPPPTAAMPEREAAPSPSTAGRQAAQPPATAETAIGRKAVRTGPASRAAPVRTLGRSAVAAPAAGAAGSDGGDIVFGQELHEDPPATVDSPEIHRAWLDRIRELRGAGEIEAARESLREYRRRYPGQTLPDDLEDLLSE